MPATPRPPRLTPRERWRRRGAMAQDALLVVVSAYFFYVHALRFADGVVTSLPFTIEQGLLVGMFLTRRRSTTTSTRLVDWLVATGGGWLPFVMQAQDGIAPPFAVLGTTVQLAGLACTITCFSYLGRSFGIVAANRGLKTSGPYALVRHPIYLSHTVTMSGFLIANFHPVNVAILATVTLCQWLRIRAEERVLTETGSYAEYRQAVPWRLIPHIY